MIYVDTNVIIYAVANDAKYGAACKRILLDLETGKLKACASVLVLVETINVLTKINKLLNVSGKAIDRGLRLLAKGFEPDSVRK